MDNTLTVTTKFLYLYCMDSVFTLLHNWLVARHKVGRYRSEDTGTGLALHNVKALKQCIPELFTVTTMK